MELFVVIANHRSGSGRTGSMIIATEVLGEAIEAALNAEDLGYNFNVLLTNVCVLRVETGQIYRRADEEVHVVLKRRREKVGPTIDDERLVWIDEWESRELKDRYSRSI